METGKRIIAELREAAESLERKYAKVTADDVVRMNKTQFDAYFDEKFNDMVKVGYLRSFAKHRDGSDGKSLISSLRWHASDIRESNKDGKFQKPMFELAQMFTEIADRYDTKVA